MEIRPFRGLRYDRRIISDVIAPPYDVLSAGDKQALLDRCDSNIVGVDMPHVPPVGEGPDEVYAAAAARLARLRKDGTLKQDDAPAIYAYQQRYTHLGQTYDRRAILTGIRATEFGKDVIPHEHTFAGPKADRLKLMQHTRMQLSPIFGFYKDPQSATRALWDQLSHIEPDQQGELNGVEERLWVITDSALISELAAALVSAKVFIADGHHRYTTAMNYRDYLSTVEHVGADHEANFVLFALVERDDPGLLILPTHRIVRGLDGFSLGELARTKGFRWTMLAAEQFDFTKSEASLAAFGPHAIAFVGQGADEVAVAELDDEAAMLAAAADQPAAWRELDVAILQTLIMDGCLSQWKTDDYSVEYTPDANIAKDACRNGASLAAIIRGTPIEAVESVALAGGAMPHKSTYFFPKLATGMVIKPLG